MALVAAKRTGCGRDLPEQPAPPPAVPRQMLLRENYGVNIGVSKYKPQLGSATPSQSGSGKSLLKRFNIRSIMILRYGLSYAGVVLALSHIPGLEKRNDIFEILLKGLPVLVAVLAAKRISELDEISIVAGVVAGVLSVGAIYRRHYRRCNGRDFRPLAVRAYCLNGASNDYRQLLSSPVGYRALPLG